ncbi:diamine acetyltransferase 2 isoform X2 [Diaphorina citri]|uniref:Diamine acetyltransferase 2 isoform X1 n=1 Tax=Diaphorina citri TaxID=121845 RepID=A0A3Q0INC5_DIACI|nr:diamine acetyltransferase 2 isoform X1 [Diaphorina citri]XP_026677803.1 diamine acetyltransferase 2 isoform X1 [Diaphorina citri]XP_026677804.1 diamine acetyltransferase 2 isoform X2 [Diaphorina citri]
MEAILKMGDIVIRPAQKLDCGQIRALIQELADYQQMPDGPKIGADGKTNDNNLRENPASLRTKSYKVLERDGFDGERPLFLSTVAEDTKTNKLVGYTLFYYLYDCFEGKYLYLEDICVTEAYRKKGFGAALFESVVKVGVETDCSSMRWDVLKWNPARKFYDKYGATNLTETKGVLFYRYYNK